MTLALLSGIIFCLGMTIAFQGRSRFQKVVGIALVAASFLGSMLVYLKEPKISISREMVVVTNHDLTEAEFSTVREITTSYTPIKIIRVSNVGTASRRAPFRRRSQITSCDDAMRLSQLYRPAQDSWLADSIEEAITSLSDQGLWGKVLSVASLRKATIVVVFSSDGDFGTTPSDGGLGVARDHLAKTDIELILINSEQRFHDTVNITLSRRALPVAHFNEITDHFVIDIAPRFQQVVKNTGRSKLFVAIDGEPASQNPRPVGNWSFPLDVRLVPSEGAPAGVLQEGFHRLDVRITTDQPGGKPLVLEGITYFRASRELTRILSSNPGTTERDLNDVIANVRPERLNWLGAKEWQIQSINEATLDDTTRTLILDRPSAQDVDRLASQNLEGRIRNGLNLHIFVPPISNVSFVPGSVKVFQGLRSNVHYDRRLYFVVDYSRLSTFNDSAGLSLQRDWINHALQSIKTSVRLSTKDNAMFGLREVACVDDKGDKPTKDCQSSDLKVMPPLGIADVTEANLRDIYASQDRTSWEKALREELAPCSPANQIAQLFREEDQSLLHKADLYPNTTVVMFSRRLADVELAGLNASFVTVYGDQTSIPIKTQPSSAKDLVNRGINLIIVWLPTPSGFEYYDNAAGNAGLNLSAIDLNRSTISPLAKDDGFSTVEPSQVDGAGESTALQGNLDAALDSSIRYRLRASLSDRTFDPRIMFGMATADDPPSEGALIDPGTDLVLASVGTSDETHAAIVGRRLGEGYVLSYSFSPLSSELLARDKSGIHKFGIQRLLDAHFVNANFQAASTLPVISAIEELQDGGTLLIHCSLAVGQGNPIPLLQIEDQPVQVQDLDLVRGVVTFQYRTDEPVPGAFKTLAFHSSSATISSSTNVFILLRGTKQPGRTTLEMLSALSSFSGGSELSPIEPASDLRARTKAFRSGVWLLGILLSVIVILLFSPLSRPWTGAHYWLDRLRRRGSARQIEATTAPRLDVHGMLTSWGQSQGQPASTRTAGAPGPHKRYEPGDALFLAKRSSLVPFTSLGKRLGLPPSKPLMKQKEFHRSIRMYICFESSGTLGYPDSRTGRKREFALALTFFVAQVASSRGGQVFLLRLPLLDSAQELNITTTIDEIDVLLVDVKGRNAPNSISAPSEAISGDIVIFITDLLAPYWTDLDVLLQSSLQDGIDLRIIQVIDPEEFRAFGMVWDVSSSIPHDRGSWSEQETARKYSELSIEVREAIHVAGGKFAAVQTNQTTQEILESLSSVLD